MHGTKTNLGTALYFKVYDLRGQRDWPQDETGVLYEYREVRTIRCKRTNRAIKRDVRYVIRTGSDQPGWRIDRLPRIGPAEAVYGLAKGTVRMTHWSTPKEAAQASLLYLTRFETTPALFSSVGYSAIPIPPGCGIVIAANDHTRHASMRLLF